jgi:hypothetical protein
MPGIGFGIVPGVFLGGESVVLASQAVELFGNVHGLGPLGRALEVTVGLSFIGTVMTRSPLCKTFFENFILLYVCKYT